MELREKIKKTAKHIYMVTELYGYLFRGNDKEHLRNKQIYALFYVFVS